MWHSPAMTIWTPRLLALGLWLLVLAAAAVFVAALPEAPLWPLLQALLLGTATLGAVLLYGEDERQGVLLLGAVLLIGLVGRIAAMALGDGVLTAADPMNYQNLARALLAGDGLVTTDIQYGRVYAHFPPLYPVLLAGFWAVFGESLWSNVAFAYLCDIVAAWAIFDIARRCGAQGAGRIAGLLLLLSPALLIAAPIPQKESLTVMLAVLLVRAMLIWGERRPAQHAWPCIVKVGLWWGLLMLTQPSLALLAPCMGLALARERGVLPVLRMGVLAGLVAALAMLPWWVRNYLLFHDFVPFTTAGGYLVNVQLGPNLLPFPPGLFDLPEPERGGVMASAAMQWIAAHPMEHAQVLLRRVANVFAYDAAAVEAYRHVDPAISTGTHSALLAALQAGWVLLLAGAAAGARRLLSLPKLSWLAPFIILFTASMLTINIWFEFAERHRYALTPFLLLLAALWWTGRRGAPQPAQP
jgi:Dolichyl-phosphate-mannose-protein mannosyltransferase